MPSDLPAPFPPFVMQFNKAGNPYPSAKLVECSVPLGVATLSLSHTNLTGSIESLDWSALAVSLTRLDLAANQLSGGAASLSVLSGLTYLDCGANRCKPPVTDDLHWSPARCCSPFVNPVLIL